MILEINGVPASGEPHPEYYAQTPLPSDTKCGSAGNQFTMDFRDADPEFRRSIGVYEVGRDANDYLQDDYETGKAPIPHDQKIKPPCNCLVSQVEAFDIV